MANRARDWTALRQPDPPPPPFLHRFSELPSSDKCPEHGALLHEFGWDGRYLCPQCMQHRWEEAHESDVAYSEAFVLGKLYGRDHRQRKSKEQDLRPVTVATWQQLRRRVRKYAKEVLKIRNAAHMDLEPLLPFIGRTPEEQWERLQGFERRVSRKSLP